MITKMKIMNKIHKQGHKQGQQKQEPPRQVVVLSRPHVGSQIGHPPFFANISGFSIFISKISCGCSRNILKLNF